MWKHVAWVEGAETGSELWPKKLDKAVDMICQRAFTNAPPRTLSHYTSDVDTILKIATNRYLWAVESTKARGGEHDLEIATPTILRVLNELADAYPSRRRLLEHTRDDYPKNRVSQLAKIYVTCLTPYPDNQSMWAEFGGRGRGPASPSRCCPRHPYSPIAASGYTRSNTIKRTYERRYGARCAASSTPADWFTTAREPWNVFGLDSAALQPSPPSEPKVSTPRIDAAYQEEWRVAIVQHRGSIIQEPGTDDRPRVHYPLRARPELLPVIERITLGPNVENAEAKISDLRAALAVVGYGVDGMPEVVRSECRPFLG